MTSLSTDELNGDNIRLSRHTSNSNLNEIKPIIRSLYSTLSTHSSSNTLFNRPSLSIQQLHRINSNEIEQKTKINDLEYLNQQLQIHSGQINEENKRLKIALEHEKQRVKIEQTSFEQKFHKLENDYKDKLHQMKIHLENEKREHTKIYEELLQETNQRLKTMEHNYKRNQANNQTMIDEMEKRFNDLRIKIEYLQEIKEKFHEEKQHLNKQNEYLQIQIQELNTKQQQNERDYNQHYEILRKENDLLKTKSNKIIDDLEHKLATIIQQVEQMQKYSQEKFLQQQKRIHILENESQDNQLIKQQYEQLKQSSIETKHTNENNKKNLIDEYEKFIKKLENEFTQKIFDYEKRMEILISNTEQQWKLIENDFQNRISKQIIIINDQEKIINKLKEEFNQMKNHYERSVKEKNEIKEQFDSYMKNLENNFQILTSKKEQLERKLSYLIEEHKRQLIEYRLSYENHLKGLLTNDVRIDLETTIHSLKQQIILLQQRIGFIQQELDQYIQLYGHLPTATA